MAYGHVAINAHHGQGEDAGEHVVVINGDEDFASHFSKWPRVEQVVGALEGHGGGDQSISHSQVKDVDIGGCFHFGVSRKKRGKLTVLIMLCVDHLLCKSEKKQVK